jgi:hypothetical protein
MAKQLSQRDYYDCGLNLLVVRAMTEKMWFNSPMLVRSWSLIAVVAIFGLVVSGILLSEPGRALASVFCMALVVQSWAVQRRYARTRERLVLFTLALGLPALASLWLGLNVLRFYSYAPESRAQLYSTVVRLQELIQNVAYAIGLVVFFWTIVELSCFLAERISLRLVGHRKTWWNRRFKGTWLLGSPIGFALAALISSSLLRSLVVVLSVLGCFFALIFRITRPHDEM